MLLVSGVENQKAAPGFFDTLTVQIFPLLPVLFSRHNLYCAGIPLGLWLRNTWRHVLVSHRFEDRVFKAGDGDRWIFKSLTNYPGQAHV